MLPQGKVFVLAASLLTTALLPSVSQADSWRRDRHERYHYRHHHNHHHHHHRPRRDYPRHGDVYLRLPGPSITIVFGRKRYYYCDGVYYSPAPRNGYVVVAPPPESVTRAEPQQNQDLFVVNIPDKKGDGYTAVTIRRTKEGFSGPQGEFYNEFPTVEQLKVMYGK